MPEIRVRGVGPPPKFTGKKARAPEFRRTFSNILFEAYVLNKARRINTEFSYRDFLELEHDAFRRIILKLRQKGEVVVVPQRSIPRLYVLAERLKENTRNRGTNV
jgi:hypothetical protein